MSTRQDILDYDKYICKVCGRRVTNAKDAVVIPSPLEYVHKSCYKKLEDPMAKALKQHDADTDETPRRSAKKVDAKKSKTDKAGKAAKSTKATSSRVSKTGKFKCIRHLVETILAKKPDASFEEVSAKVEAEYPKSQFNAKHLSWYKNRIIVNEERNYDKK